MKKLSLIILIALAAIVSYFYLHQSEFFIEKGNNSIQHIYRSDWIKALKPYDKGGENTQKMVSQIKTGEIELFESQLSLMLGESKMINELGR